MTTGFLVFLSNLLFCGVSYFSSEHKPLFIPIGLYFIKKHVWRVKMFHKTVYKAWNLFNLFEQSQEKFYKKSWFSTFDRSKVPFDQSSAFFNRSNRNRIAIETSRDFKIFLYHFRSIEPKFQSIENAWFRIFT